MGRDDTGIAQRYESNGINVLRINPFTFHKMRVREILQQRGDKGNLL